MGSISQSYTFTGSETVGQWLFSFFVSPFTGSYTVELVTSQPVGDNSFFGWDLYHAGDGSVCLHDGGVMNTGDNDRTWSATVGTPSFVWACTNWDSFRFSWGKDSIGGWHPLAGMGITVTLTADGISPSAPCPYGAERNPDSGTYTAVTEDLYYIIAGLLGWGPVAIIAGAAVIGAPMIYPICDIVPPTPQAILDSDLLGGTGIPAPGSLKKFSDNFWFGVWKFYCQCKPPPGGGPRPPEPPNPPVPPKLRVGPQPKVVCDPTNPCETFNYIVNILTQIQASISFNRYSAPTTRYTLGTRHAGLSGDGQFAVSGILGVVAQFTTLPPRVGIDVGDPNRIWEVGWINVGTADGWHTRAFMTANPWMFFPPDMQNMTEIGYSVPHDVVVDLVELVPAP